MAGEFFAQVRFLVRDLGSLDLAYANLLDEHVRRDRHNRLDWVMSGMDQRDRRAVAVSDQDRSVYVELSEQLGKHFERLLVHERRGARLSWRIGLAVSVARERDRPPSRGYRQALRKAPPQADGPEPLVQ